jgi:hypothetical protein
MMAIQLSHPAAALNVNLSVIADAQSSATLLSLTFGFVLVVVALHAGEVLVLAVRGHWWWLAGLGAASCLGVLILLTHLAEQILHTGGIPLGDVLGLLGAQSALLVCLAPRLAARRLHLYAHPRRGHLWHLTTYQNATPTASTTLRQRLRERLAEQVGRDRRR